MTTEEIKNTIGKMLDCFNNGETTVDVVEKDENLKIRLGVDDAGFLIGREGENLRDLELIIRIMLYNSGCDKRISLDINNYKLNQEKQIRDRARDIAKRVLITKEQEEMPNLNSYERRIVHEELSTNPGIETESSGERVERVLIVKPCFY